ncbi:MAG TPA: hypothetical protein DCL18_00450 [Prevotella sp.]|nr:hypothetical protein [Prevotella sp.]
MSEDNTMYAPLKMMMGHSRPYLTEEKIREITSFVNGVHQSTYTSYIIDTSDFTITQVDLADVPDVLLGMGKKKRPLSDMLEKIPQDDLARINSYGIAICEKMSQSMTENLTSQNFIFNHHVQYKGYQMVFDQRLVPLACFSNGVPYFLLCTIRVSPLHNVPYLIYRNVEKDLVEVYIPEVDRWQALRKRDVTMQERMIMRLSMQGFSIKQIAEKMCLSDAAIKKIRNQLFKKLQVQSITHAVAMVRYLNL